MTTDKTARKERPIARGVLDYFPDAIAEVSHVSFIGNQQHNPGEPMHWARGKSTDHADCIVRHLIERGTMDDDNLRHTAKAAWRALALLQEELEAGTGRAPAPNCMQPPERAVRYRNPNRQRVLDCLTGLGCPVDVAHQVANGVTFTYEQTEPFAYIAGPMRGYEKFNFPAFDAARDLAVHSGWNVISPADIDRHAGITEDTPVEATLDPCVFVLRDFFALFFIAHNPGGAIVMCSGWEKSTGAVAEFFLARWLGLKVLNEFGQPLPAKAVDHVALSASIEKFLVANLKGA